MIRCINVHNVSIVHVANDFVFREKCHLHKPMKMYHLKRALQSFTYLKINDLAGFYSKHSSAPNHSSLVAITTLSVAAELP